MVYMITAFIWRVIGSNLSHYVKAKLIFPSNDFIARGDLRFLNMGNGESFTIRNFIVLYSNIE